MYKYIVRKIKLNENLSIHQNLSYSGLQTKEKEYSTVVLLQNLQMMKKPTNCSKTVYKNLQVFAKAKNYHTHIQHFKV